MRLYSYVVAHDYGFAPNPFYGVCTLATCKPPIRKGAAIEDYIVGTGSARRNRSGHLVYFMRVERILTFDEYWSAPEFECKRPARYASRMRAYGDNVYHRDPVTGVWIQENSFHSHPDGSPHWENTKHDTQSDRVLVGRDFVYWGGSGPKIPVRFRNYGGSGKGHDICQGGQGYRFNLVPGLAEEFIAWIRSLNGRGQVGRPADWPHCI